MSMRKILVDDTNRELCPHGTESFPMTVSHDDLWDFEGKVFPFTGIMIWRSAFPEKEKPSIRFIKKAII